MKFNELARSILEDDIQTPLRVPQVGKERYPHEMEDDIVSQEEENNFDREEENNFDGEEAAYQAAREILDSLKARNPEKYGKIVSALNYLISHNE